MPNEALIALAALAAYLLGSVPFAVIVSRAFKLADPRTYGSKNPGATNVLRSGNKAAAALTLLGDALKGWLAVFLAQHYQLGNLGVGLVALAVFFGHLFPVFLKFKGGKGVATAAGVLIGLDAILGFGVIGVWVSVAFAVRYSSLAAVCAAAAAPLLTGMMLGTNGGIIVVVSILSAALIAKHWQNIQRLMTGKETRIGASKS
ncbi:MAG TPA: glycerol-3-phosphate 1-O-acyltransferase PlsY [Rhodocyclaceae bacterium]|nr:glycerol-3-phosphate 1-O-acyltransferase PlsY [Rhodocyclaceae bacterium]